MNIAIVYATFDTRGGAENSILWLATELLRRGHRVTIFTSDFDPAGRDLPEAVRRSVVEVLAGGNYSTFLDWWIAGLRLRKRMRGFDLIHPHNFPANAWVYFAKRRSPSFPPVLWFCHEPPRTLYDPDRHVQKVRHESLSRHFLARFRRDRSKVVLRIAQKTLFFLLTHLGRGHLRRFHIDLDRRAVESTDRILANSRYTAAEIRERYERDAIPCYIGIPIEPDPPLPFVEKKPVFLSVARLEPAKHVDTILRAFRSLTRAPGGNEASLVVVGTGTEEARLKELARELNLREQVTFTGYVGEEQLARHYRAALAVVYVPEAEPFGLVPLEAMRHRTAAIVSNSAGTAETVIDRVTGLHVEAGNVEQLAAAMAALLHDRSRALEMGRNGYEHVTRSFAFSGFVDRFEQHAASLVEAPRLREE